MDDGDEEEEEVELGALGGVEAAVGMVSFDDFLLPPDLPPDACDCEEAERVGVESEETVAEDEEAGWGCTKNPLDCGSGAGSTIDLMNSSSMRRLKMVRNLANRCEEANWRKSCFWSRVACK